MSSGGKRSVGHEAERQEAGDQVGTLDLVMNAPRALKPFGGGGRGFRFGRSSFEGHSLNEMIDIVDSADPELLEDTGRALWDARDAITEAADTLERDLRRVDWEGEAHRAFSTWGGQLIETARDLATYTEVVGTQVTAAGAGLASVRRSMPPRDTRTDPRAPEDFDPVERDTDEGAYRAALTAEKNRQEAINQMYRLASFYTVSTGVMQNRSEPVFPRMPGAGVPKPAGAVQPGTVEGRPGASGVEPRTHSVRESGAGAPPEGAVRLPTEPSEVRTRLPEQVRTEIDSVGTLTPPHETTGSLLASAPQVTSPGGVSAGVAPPFAGGPLPMPSAAGRTGGAPATPSPTQGRGGAVSRGVAAGAAVAPPVGPVATPVGPVATPVGPAAPPVGPAARVVEQGGTGGRAALPAPHGVVGGMPRPVVPSTDGRFGGPPGTAGAAGARTPAPADTGRPPGVVGGMPVPHAPSGSAGTGIPRGTVIGAGTPLPPPAGRRAAPSARRPTDRTGRATSRPDTPPTDPRRETPWRNASG